MAKLIIEQIRDLLVQTIAVQKCRLELSTSTSIEALLQQGVLQLQIGDHERILADIEKAVQEARLLMEASELGEAACAELKQLKAALAPTELPADGTYAGLQTGYDVTYRSYGGVYTTKATVGIRGINRPVTVRVLNGVATVVMQ